MATRATGLREDSQGQSVVQSGAMWTRLSRAAKGIVIFIISLKHQHRPTGHLSGPGHHQAQEAHQVCRLDLVF
jgi:hypothetical protein